MTEWRDEDFLVEDYDPYKGHKVRPVEVISGQKITHIPTGLSVTCNTSRSKLANKGIAMKALRNLVKLREN